MQVCRQADRQTDRQTDGQADRQTDRKADGQTSFTVPAPPEHPGSVPLSLRVIILKWPSLAWAVNPARLYEAVAVGRTDRQTASGSPRLGVQTSGP